MTAAAAAHPRATMRLQLHKDFTFADAAALAPYLAAMGVSHLYASPILTARAGSIHGYDVVDPTAVNPELGGEAGLKALVAALRHAGLGLIVDIVPNHMAVGADDNVWWADVLRNGRSSRYASYFDIDWDRPDPLLHGKVLAPFLGKPYGQALADGELRLGRDKCGHPTLRYYDASYPINVSDEAEVNAAGEMAYDPRTADGRARLHRLLERQHYRLAWWRTAADDINWRRFFDINGLAGLRIELPEIFEATHATLFRLYEAGLIDGFRIDHVDGLSDPPGYCRRLRRRLEELAPKRPPEAPTGPAYVVVEKILGEGEHLPADWGIDGTSGYDFMDTVSALLHDAAAAAALAALWGDVSGRPSDFHVEEKAARREILERGFEAQLSATAAAFHALALLDPATRDLPAPAIRRALIAVLANFPVYRGYNLGSKRSPADDAVFTRAFAAAKGDSPRALHVVLDQLDKWLGAEEGSHTGEAMRRRAVTQFQQLSAPVAAKAVEDTAFYRYGRLLSRNDVGFAAGLLGQEPEAFHEACAARLREFPDSMLATATHDHKRGEDLRCRLAVLSEMPETWAEQVRAWLAEHRNHPMPWAGDAAMLYQMIVAAWPPGMKSNDSAGRDAFRNRLAIWQQKAMREAKLQTDWTAPDEDYEKVAKGFLTRIMSDVSGFPGQAAAFVRRIAPAGAVNGLAQTVLKLTVPGVPDLYQGTELWDFSLVDPDNRRPVDFETRRAALAASGQPEDLVDHWQDGRVKQAVVKRILAARRADPAAFARGSYVPIAVSGPRARHVVAFARIRCDTAILVIVSRLASSLLPSDGTLQIPRDVWADTRLHLPPALSDRRLSRILTEEPPVTVDDTVRVSDILQRLPVAVLRG